MNRPYIISQITESLNRGESTEEAFERFIYYCMFLDRNYPAAKAPTSPTPLEVWEKLKDNGVISQEDIFLKHTKVADVIYDTELIVKIHPSLTVAVESYDGFKVAVNGVSKVKNWVWNLSAEETAQWMIRMKQNMPGYIAEWDEILNTVSKTLKGQKLAMSVINAIIVNVMNNYQKVKYAIKAQKARARIDFILPNGVCKTIYAYWKSYPQKLPEQLEELKTLIDKLEN